MAVISESADPMARRGGRHGASRRSTARLQLAAPLFLGFSTIFVFFGLGVGSAAYAPIDKGIGMPGTIIVESKVRPIQHPKGGVVGKVFVHDGQDVKAGDLLISFDTVAIDEQITALKLQANASRKQLALAKEEAATMTDLMERKLAARSRVLALERAVADVEKDIAGLNAKIVIAQQELAQSELRSPFDGRVLSLAVSGHGAVVQPGQTVMELVPEEDRLVIEGHIAPNQIENVKPGMQAKVWLSALSWREQRPLRAKLAWVSPDSVEDKRTGAPYYVARVELVETRSQIAKRLTLLPGMRAEILLQTGERTLLDQVIDPLMRNVTKAFRG